MAKSGVFPCYENQFAVGAPGEETPNTSIANCTKFEVSIDNGIEEWNAFESEGWKSRLMTAKSVTISVSAKRTIGDIGNDMIAAVAYKNGKDVELNFLWTFPDGSTLLLKNAVISITNPGTGESTNAAPFEFEVMSNGKPEYTAVA